MTSRLYAPKFRPGVNKSDSGLQNEGGYADSNMVRVYRGLPQTVGGCELAVSGATLEGKARGSHSWRTIAGKPVFATGTSSHLYAVVGGELRDITPNLHRTVLTNVFTTVSGSPTVTVTLPFHGLPVGLTVTFSNHQTTVAGLTIEGDFTVQSVPTRDTFTITASGNASTTEASPTGGNVDFVAPLPAGVDDRGFAGYGTDGYGEGPYGTSSADLVDPRTWSLDNWGENLLANPSGSALFEFQPADDYPELLFNPNFTGSADGWALGTGWAHGTNRANKTSGVASNLSQNVEGVLEGGRVYLARFAVSRAGGSLKLRMNAGATPAVIDIGAASAAITKTGTYFRLFLCPADPVDLVFEADSSFQGWVDTTGLTLMDIGYRIDTAPPRIDSMFVDPVGIVVALGTTLVDGSYSATAVRNSDLGSNRSWVPDTGSLASEQVLRGGGGRLMQGIAARQQNLIGADDGIFSAQYLGEEGAAYTFRLLGTGCGLISRKCLAEHNGFAFWMSNADKFCILRGVGATSLGIPETIPCPIREDVFDNLDRRQMAKCHAGINPAFSEAWFFYPDTRDTPASETDVPNPGECSRVAVVAWTEGTEDAGVPWVSHIWARTTWEPQGTLDYSWAVTPDGLIMAHEMGYTDNGNPLNEYIETADFDKDDGDTLMAILGFVPDFKGQTGNVGLTVKSRFWPNSPDIERGPFIATPTTQRLNFRANGRQHRIRLTGETQGGFWRLGSIRLDIAPTGARR